MKATISDARGGFITIETSDGDFGLTRQEWLDALRAFGLATVCDYEPALRVDLREPPPLPFSPALQAVCRCPADVCPVHGTRDKAEARKGRRVRTHTN